jgi:hypothetical protein
MSVRFFWKIGIGLGLGNYALYALATYLVGGDALHGHVVDGHYMVQAATRFVEVSRAAYLFGRFEAYSLLATFPLGLLSAVFLSSATQPDEPGNNFGRHESWTAASPRNGR